MSEPTHLTKLEEGVESWNAWRNEFSTIIPDLSGADFAGRNLEGVNFSATYLADINLQGAQLHKANLVGAELAGANLSNADLSTIRSLITGNELALQGSTTIVSPS